VLALSLTLLGLTGWTGTITLAIASSSQTSAWITVGQVKTIDYYLTLLQSNGTEPYVQVATELGKLPDLQNATAVAEITYLALNATNPEVREAFQLIIKGGTPDQNDLVGNWKLQYSVPTYNTELEVLYWLACQNEFKKDDTLALAIAIVNGLWVSMGDEQVRAAVQRDTSLMLTFGRETSEWQRSVGLSYNLEQYPLEAKVCWAWTGNDPGRGGHYIIDRLYSGKSVSNPTGKSLNLHPLTEYTQRLDLKGYVWNTVDPNNLARIRQFILDKKYGANEMSQVAITIDQRLNSVLDYKSPNDSFIVVNGETTVNHNMNNANFEFEYLLSTGKIIGVCDDRATIVDAFLKSIGISSSVMIHVWGFGGASHTHIFYYDAGLSSWSAPNFEFELGSQLTYSMANVYLVRPPLNLKGYLSTHSDLVWPSWSMLSSYYLMGKVSPTAVRNQFQTGIGSGQMKQWLIYG